MRVVLGSTLAFTALVALVIRHTFDGTGWVNSFVFVFRVWVQFNSTEANIFYVSIRTTENCQFDKFRTAGVTGNAIINSQGQGDNPVCSTRDEISQPSRPFSPRAATAVHFIASSSARFFMMQNGSIYQPLKQTETCLLRLYSSKHIAENS